MACCNLQAQYSTVTIINQTLDQCFTILHVHPYALRIHNYTSSSQYWHKHFKLLKAHITQVVEAPPHSVSHLTYHPFTLRKTKVVYIFKAANQCPQETPHIHLQNHLQCLHLHAMRNCTLCCFSLSVTTAAFVNPFPTPLAAN